MIRVVVQRFFSLLARNLARCDVSLAIDGSVQEKSCVHASWKKAKSCMQKFQLEDVACKSEFHFLRRVWYTFLIESSCSQTCTHPVMLEDAIIGRDPDNRPLPPSSTLGNGQSLPPFTSLMTRWPMTVCVAPFPLTLVALFLLLYCCHLTLTN